MVTFLTQVQQQVLDGLKTGNAALEKANAVFSLEEVESIMSDTVRRVGSGLVISCLSGRGRGEAERDREDALRRTVSGRLPELLWLTS